MCYYQPSESTDASHPGHDQIDKLITVELSFGDDNGVLCLLGFNARNMAKRDRDDGSTISSKQNKGEFFFCREFYF
jgi:hypothetical protein